MEDGCRMMEVFVIQSDVKQSEESKFFRQRGIGIDASFVSMTRNVILNAVKQSEESKSFRQRKFD